MITLFGLLSLASTGIALIMGTLVISRNHREPVNRIFFALCLAIAYWSFTKYEHRIAGEYDEALFWIHISFVWALPSAMLLHFVLVYTGNERFLQKKWPFMLLYGPSVIIAVLTIVSDDYSGLPKMRPWGWSIEPLHGRLTIFSYFYISLLTFSALLICLRFFLKQDDPRKRIQSGLTLAGISVYAIAPALSYILLPLLKIRIPDISSVTFAVGVGGIIGYGIWKYDLLSMTPADAAEKIISTMSDALLLIGTSGEIKNINNAALDLLGYEQAEILGMSAEKIFPDGWLKECILSREGTSGSIEGVSEIETIVLTRSGEKTPVSLSSSKLHNQRKQLVGTVCIARNISERKRAEDLIKMQSEGLISRNAELTALYEISNVVRNSLDLDLMLRQALDTITSLSVFNIEYKGGIFTVEGETLRLLASLHHADNFLRAHDGIKLGDCLCGQAARSGEIIVSLNAREEDRHTKDYPEISDHGHVIVPLKAMEKVTGVLYLYLPANAEIDNRQLKLLETIAAELGIAIENARLYTETRTLSLHDPLTGLANRRLMALELDKALARAKRTGKPFSLVMADIDLFKNYNDLYGHAAGDEILAGIAKLILEEIRRIDLGARFGGEEFLLILPDTDLDEAVEVAERIRCKAAATEFTCSATLKTSGITISLGVATWDDSIGSEDILVARADTALYMAKNKGRNRVESWKQMNIT